MAKQELEDLRAQIAESISIEEEAGILIDSLQDQLTAAIDNESWDEVIVLRDALKASKEKLQSAFAENIPTENPGGVV